MEYTWKSWLNRRTMAYLHPNPFYQGMARMLLLGQEVLCREWDTFLGCVCWFPKGTSIAWRYMRVLACRSWSRTWGTFPYIVRGFGYIVSFWSSLLRCALAGWHEMKCAPNAHRACVARITSTAIFWLCNGGLRLPPGTWWSATKR